MPSCILIERAGVLVSVNPQPRCRNTRNPNFFGTNYNFPVMKVQVERGAVKLKKKKKIKLPDFQNETSANNVILTYRENYCKTIFFYSADNF